MDQRPNMVRGQGTRGIVLHHAYVVTIDGHDVYLTVKNSTREVREWLDIVARQVGGEIVSCTPGAFLEDGPH